MPPAFRLGGPRPESISGLSPVSRRGSSDRGAPARRAAVGQRGRGHYEQQKGCQQDDDRGSFHLFLSSAYPLMNGIGGAMLAALNFRLGAVAAWRGFVMTVPWERDWGANGS